MLSPTDVHSCWEDMSYISAEVNTACYRFEPAGLLLVFQLFKVLHTLNQVAGVLQVKKNKQPKLMSVCVFKTKFLHYKKKGEQ